jgi:deoxyribodipyrimidine photo-lyase
MPSTALVWFRRDLRLDDHAPLYHALRAADRVFCCFIFDTDILDGLHTRAHRRVEFIQRSCESLHRALQAMGGGLITRVGRASAQIPALAAELGALAVYASRDYEPAAVLRDTQIGRALSAAGTELKLFKDQVIFERDEVLTKDGRPYSVFTPYKRAWLEKARPFYLSSYRIAPRPGQLQPGPRGQGVHRLEEFGFQASNLSAVGITPGMEGARAQWEEFLPRISKYDERRDFPALKGPSYLSVHLRFGTISIRELARAARRLKSPGAATWLGELIWRDFYFMILAHRPDIVERSFRPEFDRVRWDDHPERFEAWCEGRTGYPIVDAGMRQLKTSGYMHNRLRMIVASFLTKDLHIDWRRGERWFAMQLNDFDLASNNGGWQWAASTGCDAQPYFRIFNPVSQSERFDPQGQFIRRYVPELEKIPAPKIHAPWTLSAAEQSAYGCRIGTDYPAPIVDHAAERAETLARFAAIKSAA